MMIKREYKQINFGKSDVGVACRGGNLFTMIENLTIVFRLKLTLLVSCIVHREPHIRLSYILDCLTLFIENHILDWPEQMITSPKMTPARLTFDEGHIHDGLKNPGGLYSVQCTLYTQHHMSDVWNGESPLVTMIVVTMLTSCSPSSPKPTIVMSQVVAAGCGGKVTCRHNGHQVTIIPTILIIND